MEENPAPDMQSLGVQVTTTTAPTKQSYKLATFKLYRPLKFSNALLVGGFAQQKIFRAMDFRS